MKKFKLLLSYFLLTGAWGFAGENFSFAPTSEVVTSKQTNDPRDITPRLIDETKIPTSYMRELLLLTGIECNTMDCCLSETQKNWIAVIQGKDGKERRDLLDTPENIAIKDQALDIIEQLGLLDEQPPLRMHYNYAICLGAFLDTARARLYDLVNAWQKGVRFDHLVFLGSDRQLRKSEGQNESITHLLSATLSPIPLRPDWAPPEDIDAVYSTEYDMLRIIWAQSDVPLDMRQHLEGHVTFVNALAPSPGLRASTRDTYYTWLNAYTPAPGTVLAASSPLVWTYQHLVGVNALGDGFLVETIAPKIHNKHDVPIVILLDTLAKCLYESSITSDRRQ